jgi:hypothetical protein
VGPPERRIVEKVVGRSSASPSREAVVGALDNCYHPCRRDRRISVVDMGLIESIEIR